MQSPEPPTEDLIFERLLAALLEHGGGPAEGDGAGAAPELLELRDMARRLRASVQWMPLPRSRLALRHALLATVEAARRRPAAERPLDRYMPAAWRRTGRWLTAMTAATFLLVGAVLGAHALEIAVSPSGPLYALALQLDAMRVELAGDAFHRASALLDVTRARAAEIGAMAYGDDPRGVEEAASALERQNRWLRSVARSLPAAEQQRLAPAAAKSDLLVVNARRAAQLRLRGRLPSGVTMVDLLNAGGGPLSGAATTDVSTPSNGSRDGGSSGSTAGGGGSGRAESGSTGNESGGLGGGGHSAGAAGGGSSASSGSGSAGGGAASSDSHKSGGGPDAPPGSGASTGAAGAAQNGGGGQGSAGGKGAGSQGGGHGGSDSRGSGAGSSQGGNEGH
jgi:hypothetical protein